MPALATHGRIIVLAVAAVALGTWHVVGMRPQQRAAERESDVPQPVPELVDDRGPARALPSAPPLTAHQDGWGLQPAAASSGAPAWTAPGNVPQGQVQGRQPAATRLLDDVFAPDRFAQPGQAAAPAVSSLAGDDLVSGRNTSAPAAVASFAVPGGRAAGTAEAVAEPAKPRQATEKAYYEAYVALSKEDAAALGRQAALVLVPDGETARQVALLRALYDLDRSQALDQFTRAISTLPDVSKPSGVSVPVFAASFLARQVGDPAAVGLAERIAWDGQLNVSQEVRNAAANVLLSRATPDDLQRYAAFPGFKPPMPQATEP